MMMNFDYNDEISAKNSISTLNVIIELASLRPENNAVSTHTRVVLLG